MNRHDADPSFAHNPITHRPTRRATHLVRGGLAIVLGCWLASAAAIAEEPLDPLLRDDGRSRGAANAPVTLIEYSDFTCGFCRKFFQETWPRLSAKYVDTGKLRFLYRDYPRANRGAGLEGAVAARCAGEQGQYWAMHDRLFSTGGNLTISTYQEAAKMIGLSQPAFMQCLRESRHVKAAFQDREQGLSFGFHGTPGFVLLRTDAGPNERVVVIPGALPYEIFEEQIDLLLAKTRGKGKG